MPQKENPGQFIFGLKDDDIVRVDNVENGLACDCFCPGCGGRLEACNNGRKVASYFRHSSSEKPCAYSHESALHFLAKKIIERAGRLKLPEIQYKISDNPSHYYRNWRFENGRKLDAQQFEAQVKEAEAKGKVRNTFGAIYGMRMIHKVNQQFMDHWWYPALGEYAIPYEQSLEWREVSGFDSIEVERSEGSFKPDLKCKIGNRTLFIEIAVTHFVDYKKKEKIKALGHSLLEIDLSDVERDCQVHVLEKILLNGDSTRADWIFNRVDEERHSKVERFCQSLSNTVESDREFREYKVYGWWGRVYKCPLIPRPGEQVYLGHCEDCHFSLDLVERDGEKDSPYNDRFIRCIGHQGQSLKDRIQAFVSDHSWVQIGENYKSSAEEPEYFNMTCEV